ncbi:LCP family protein [Streptomyces galbus]|uniref:LytR family transcriptional regulator n=1 Tax=Streptomyces galbus TaxID=33898 RepID=A0A4U5WZ04_STRGB|nr:LCP family protein [Streptomyces galbus]TKT07202.1 LytR family transcriptional regulator [Streptomyces galbus]GHD33965.1 transcriptional regulator [Streptomyces galbus]
MAQSSVRGEVPAVEDTMSLTPQEQEPADDTEPGGPDGGASGTDGKGGKSGRGRPRRRRRVLRWSATVLAVVILGTAGAGYLYYQHLNANIRSDDLNLGDAKDRAAQTKANAAGQTPLNILLIGSDARDTAENQKLGGARDTFGGPPLADVQMLLHVSADRSNMSVVSIPRDTLLSLPKCTDPDDGKVYPATQGRMMANESLGRGGPGCTVATWEKLTGIHIDHFMMIDFSGVVSMADAIGGVPVCVDANVYSHTSAGKGSGLKLRKGTTSVQGEQALQWLRTRYGFEDDTDLARAKAQHMYMNSMVRELRASAKLTSPNKLRKLAEAATKAITVDNGLDSIKKMYDLAGELQRVPTERITMTTMPNRYVGSRVEPTEDAETLFRMIRDDVALDGKDKAEPAASASATPTATADAPAAIAVQVLNGTATDTEAAVRGRAGTIADLLTGKGFTRAVADHTAATAEPTTVVRYPSADLQADAQAVARALGLPAGAVKKSTDVSGITLVVGADWRSGTAYQAPAKKDRTPDSAQAINAADTSQCMHVDPAYVW